MHCKLQFYKKYVIQSLQFSFYKKHVAVDLTFWIIFSWILRVLKSMNRIEHFKSFFITDVNF